MKRSLIALAVSAAVVAPAAMAADVTVYGIAQVEVASYDYQSATATDGVSVEDNSMGRVGFKASEDLGGGLTGLAVLEYKIDTADGAADTADKGGTANASQIALTPRETMVGIKGGFGQVELGNLKQAYKYTGGVKYDPFVATALQARGNGGMVAKVKVGTSTQSFVGQAAFHDNVIGYRGKFGPVSVGLTYGPEEGDGSMTLAAKFSNPMFEAFVAMVDTGDRVNNGADSYSATKIGGQVRMAGGAHKISLQYEMGSLDVGVTTTDPTTSFLGYQGKFGSNLFVAQFGAYDSDGGANDTSYLAVGAYHMFSKTTKVFGGYRNSDADNDSKESVVSIGLNKKF